MSWRGIIIALLLVGAAISGWSLLNQQAGEPSALGTSGRPDYVLNDFELVVLDADGSESFAMRAPTLARDPASREMEIATPLFTVPPGPGAGGDAWEVRARSGWVSAEGDELRLRGDVHAVSDGTAAAPVTITTEELNLYTEDNRVSSAVEVNINRPGSILRGRGLDLDLNTKLYTLHSEVRSHYAPIR